MKTKRKEDGSRWAVWEKFDIRDGANREQVYLRRWYLIETPYFGVFLHKINLPDQERPIHDHPWNFLGIVLRGGYSEWVKVSKSVGDNWLVLKHRKFFNFKRATEAHRIESIDRSPTWTLLFVGKRQREWGFHTPAGWVQWDHYLMGEDAQEAS